MGLALSLLFSALAFGQTQPVDASKASIEGQVINTTSAEPVRKARVTLRLSGAQPQDAQITVSTDATGKFEFPNLEAGSYRLTARRDGFANASQGKDPILIGQGDHKSGVAIKMVPFGVITGRVTDPDGDPIRGITVAAMTYQYTSKGRQLQEQRNATTNDVGEYRIFDIAQGKYFIKTVPRGLQVGRNAEDAESYASIYYPGVPEPTAANAVELGAGREVSGIDFMLRKTRYATIRGRIATPEGASNISVGLMTTSDSGTSTSTTNAEKDGKFQIAGVAPGLVYLVGSFVLNGQRHYAQVPLQIAADDINGIALHPIPPMDLSGHVRIEGQSTTKPSQVRISLEGPGHSYGAEAGGISDDGRLLFRNIDPNTYRVTPGRLAELYLKSVQWGSADITEGELDLNSGVPARTELTVVLGADGGQIEGIVENEKPEPVPAVTVMLVPVSGRKSAAFFKNITTDSAGRFTIKGIAPGAYKLYAWDKVNTNAVIYDPEFLPEYDSVAKRVEVASNESKKVDLKLIANKHQQ